MEWVIVDAYMAYKQCASDREHHDLNAEYGYGYGAYLHSEYYAQFRWRTRD